MLACGVPSNIKEKKEMVLYVEKAGRGKTMKSGSLYVLIMMMLLLK